MKSSGSEVELVRRKLKRERERIKQYKCWSFSIENPEESDSNAREMGFSSGFPHPYSPSTIPLYQSPEGVKEKGDKI